MDRRPLDRTLTEAKLRSLRQLGGICVISVDPVITTEPRVNTSLSARRLARCAGTYIHYHYAYM